MIERFRRLLRHPGWHDAYKEPYLLFSIIYEKLYNTVDKLAWKLADIFRPVETAVLDRARTGDALNETTVDFTSMHNIAKHCIYMNEAVEASILTLDEMVSHLTRTRQASSSIISSPTYRKSTFKSTQLRLQSMDKRMANMISLSFNLVTQHDSRVMQNDNSAMKVIAVMTLIFLPATGIASIFSTPFFEVDFQNSKGNRMLKVARSFWISWVVSIPLTAILFSVWYLIYREAKQKRAGATKKRRRWLLRQEDSEPINFEGKHVAYDSSFHRAPPHA